MLEVYCVFSTRGSGSKSHTCTIIKCMTFTANGTGGEYYHKLTADENGKHKHAQTLGTDNAVVGGYNDAYAINEQVYGGYANTVARTTAYRQAVQYSGEGKGHNNTPPYRVVYYWHRVS